MTALATQEPRDWNTNVKEVKAFLENLITETLPKLAGRAGEKESPFFRNGIELIELRLKVVQVELEIVLAGPNPKNPDRRPSALEGARG
jgi:hypothetical protein